MSWITKAFIEYLEDEKRDLVDLEAFIDKEAKRRSCPLKRNCFALKNYNEISNYNLKSLGRKKKKTKN